MASLSIEQLKSSFSDNQDMVRLCEAFQGEINLLKHRIEEKDQRIKVLEEKLKKHQDAYKEDMIAIS